MFLNGLLGLALMFASPSEASAIHDGSHMSEPGRELGTLASESRSVVRGTVVGTQANATPRGIRTTYTVVVDATLTGARVDEVTVVLPGGTVPGVGTERVSGVPIWHEGDDVVLFVPEDGRIRLKGAFTVLRDDMLEGTLVRHGPPGFPRTVGDLIDRLRTVRPHGQAHDEPH